MTDNQTGRREPGHREPDRTDAGESGPADDQQAAGHAAGHGADEPSPGGITRVTPADLGLPEEEGGEAACYAHLVCPECGCVVTEGHGPGCSEAAG